MPNNLAPQYIIFYSTLDLILPLPLHLPSIFLHSDWICALPPHPLLRRYWEKENVCDIVWVYVDHDNIMSILDIMACCLPDHYSKKLYLMILMQILVYDMRFLQKPCVCRNFSALYILFYANISDIPN